jgi:Two component regulator propeller.
VQKIKSCYLFATTTGLLNYDTVKRTSDVQLQGISVLSLYKGTQNILWTGTDTKGIFKFLPQRQYFNAFTKEQIPELGNHATRTIYKDVDNNLWVGTKGGGLISISYPGVRGLQKIRKFSETDELINNSVLSITPATGKNFWIGTDGSGVNYYCYTRKKLKN